MLDVLKLPHTIELQFTVECSMHLFRIEFLHLIIYSQTSVILIFEPYNIRIVLKSKSNCNQINLALMWSNEHYLFKQHQLTCICVVYTCNNME